MRKLIYLILALVYLLVARVTWAQIDIALGKPAQQSSTFSRDYPASQGVDGRKDNRHMFHTGLEQNPWWQVDLQGDYAISYIMLYNRTDCCAERERMVQVLLSQNGFDWQTIYANNGRDFRELRVDAHGRRAHYVRVQLAGQNYFHLQEVEVYGAEGGRGISRWATPEVRTEGPPSTIILDNWNTAACGFTNNAVMNLPRPAYVESVQLWYNWGAGETSLPYTLSGDHGAVRQGEFHRGSCDPYQTAWCEATDSIAMHLAPGTYTFTAARRHVCQNLGSNGMGFIHVRGQFGMPENISIMREATPEVRGGSSESKTILDNWNTAGCAFTGSAVMNLAQPTHVERVVLWYNWEAGESSLPYAVSEASGRVVRNGQFRRGSCDPYQRAWCEAVDDIDTRFAPGYYTFNTARARVCQNGGSSGMGFIRVTGRQGFGGPDHHQGEQMTQPVPPSTREVHAGFTNNLALGKPAQQSSLYGGGYEASKGVDGQRGNFFHTAIEDNPWWQVDLEGNYRVSYIMLYNRTDCCGERERTVQVKISQNGYDWQTIYTHDGSPFQQVRVDARGRWARYVRVQLAERNYFHLEEVEVYGKR